MVIIYLAYNKNNHKCYIGQTHRSLKTRITSHVYDATKGNSNSYFHHAIRKHNHTAFDWIVLDTVEDQCANESEGFWIQYYKYIGVELYNMATAKDGTVRGIKRSQITKDKIANTKRMQAANRGIIYLITHPDGTETYTHCLYDFVLKYGLNTGHAYSVARGERTQTSGYRIKKLG